jgi:hypothetical protein
LIDPVQIEAGDSIVNHDDRAAFVCALTALSVATADFVAVGDDDGWIVLPPRQFIQSRQWSLLSINAGEEEAGALRSEDAQQSRSSQPPSPISARADLNQA